MSAEIAKISQLGSMGSVSPTGTTGQKPSVGGPSFEETLSKLQQPHLQPNMPSSSFTSAQGVKFSNHAVERMRSRGISFNQDDLTRLQSAVQKAADKGSKDSLVLMNDSALIVSVKNNTVVTVVDKASLKENVFTNIDSTIVI